MDEFEKVNELTENEPAEEKAVESELNTEDEKTESASESEKVVDEDVEEAEETSETEAESEDDDSDEEAEDETPEKPKKQFILERTIIKSICVFLVALIAFGAASIVQAIMTPGIEGTWVMKKAYLKSDPKQAQKSKTSSYDGAYYTFSSDKSFEYVSGSVVQKGKWAYVDANGAVSNDKTDIVIIYFGNDKSNAEQWSWSVEGNAFSDKTLKTEVSTMFYGVVVQEFISYSGSEIPKYQIKPDKNFTPVKEFTGTWEDKLNKTTLELKEDGTYSMSRNNYYFRNGTYSLDTKKKLLTLNYFQITKQSDSFEYTLKDNKLKLIQIGQFGKTEFGEFVKTK